MVHLGCSFSSVPHRLEAGSEPKFDLPRVVAARNKIFHEIKTANRMDSFVLNVWPDPKEQ